MSLFSGIKWPYATMQQLNLDWILERIKNIENVLSIKDLSADTDINLSNDYLVFYDASSDENRKISPANLMKTKQNTLSAQQLAAVNSGITATKVANPINFTSHSLVAATPDSGLTTRVARVYNAVSDTLRYAKIYGFLDFTVGSPSEGEKIYTFATSAMPIPSSGYEIAHAGLAWDQSNNVIHSHNVKLRFTQGSRNVQLVVNAGATVSRIYVDLFPSIYQLINFGDE